MDPPNGVPSKPRAAKATGAFIAIISTGELMVLKADSADELASAISRKTKQLTDSRLSVACVRGTLAEIQAPKPQLSIKFDKSTSTVEIEERASTQVNGDVVTIYDGA